MTKTRVEHTLFSSLVVRLCWMVPRRIQYDPLKRMGRGLLVATEEDMAPLCRLLVLGFLAHTPQGANGPQVIMCVRQRMDLYDTVRAHSPEKCEAVRVVGGQVVKETAGSFAEVVAEVEEWPMVLTATGEDIA
jgi:hypothetical protein